MASIYVGLNFGDNTAPDGVTEGSSTGSTDVELRFDTGKGMTREDVILITQRLQEYIADGRFLPTYSG